MLYWRVKQFNKEKDKIKDTRGFIAVNRNAIFSFFIVLTLFLGGCAGKNFDSSLRSSKTEIIRCPWASYEKAEKFYQSIEDGKTTVDDLRGKGFDPNTAPNTTKLSHIDVRNIFLSPSLTMRDMPDFPSDSSKGHSSYNNSSTVPYGGNTPAKGGIFSYIPEGVLRCMNKNNPGECYGYTTQCQYLKSQGRGNIILEWTKWKVEMHISGWELSSTFIVKGSYNGGIIEHKIWRGTPRISKITAEHDPKYVLFGGAFILFKFSPFSPF